jgi:hypothetical protein
VIFNDVPGSMLRDPAAAACLCKCRQQTVILARQVAAPTWGRGHSGFESTPGRLPGITDLMRRDFDGTPYVLP